MAQDDLIIKIIAETDNATKQINKLNKEIKALGKTADGKWSKNTKKGFDSVSKSANNLNSKLKALAVTYLSFQTAKSLVTTAAAIEEGFLGVAKTTGLTGDAFDELKDSILDLGTEMAGVSLEELQTIAENAGQLGISGKENILEFTEVIAKMASTTELSAEQAAQGMAKFSNVMKLPTIDASKLGSAINELSNNAAASAGEILNVSQRMAPMAKTFGLTAQEVLGFSTALKDMGTNTEVAGSSMTRLMGLMLSDVEGFAKASGVSIEEFTRLLKDEPIKALNLFLNKLGELDKFGKIKTLEDLKINSVETRGAVIKLADGMDKVTESVKRSTEAWEDNTSLDKEYAIFSEGFNAQMEKVLNTIKKLASNIGEQLLPALKKASEDFAEWVNSLDDTKLAEFGDDIASVATALANVAGAVGSFVTSMGSFVTDYPKLSKGLLGLILALKSINLLLPAVGTAMVTMGTRSSALGAASVATTTGVMSLKTALVNVAKFAGPWGVAMAAMATATTLAIDSYVEGVKKANEATNQASSTLTSSAEGTDALSDAYIKLNGQIAENGKVTQAQYDVLEKGIRDELSSTSQRISKMEQVKTKTKEQTAAIMDQSAKLGSLKAQLDILPTKYTIDLEIEARQAEKELEDALKKTEDKKIEKELAVKTFKAEKDIEDFEKSTKNKKIEAELEIETQKAIKDVDDAKKTMKKPTTSEHTVDDNVPDVLRDINKLKVTTYSDHIIRQRIVPAHADGGFITPIHRATGGEIEPLHLADGGYASFKRMTGKIPGHDTTGRDDVPIMGTRGEYMQPVKAVDYYGVSGMDAIRRMAIPKDVINAYSSVGSNTGSFRMPKGTNHLAAGGSVGGAYNNVSGDLAPINLTIGTKSFGLMGDREVAEALTRYIRTEGGL